tara:strand:+ start:1002 stop:1517 length:516 start_codon:yes stop_codon:yes gene_type:complete
MAGSLIKIAETTVSSAVASVTLTGIDSTYDVYQLVIRNLQSANDNTASRYRVTKGGTVQTDSEYDNVYKYLTTSGTFGNGSATNIDRWYLDNQGTGTGEAFNANIYLFNFPNASEYSFATKETVGLQSSPNLTGLQGGDVHTVASASDGVEISMDSGNITAGTITLYGLKK